MLVNRDESYLNAGSSSPPVPQPQAPQPRTSTIRDQHATANAKRSCLAVKPFSLWQFNVGLLPKCGGGPPPHSAATERCSNKEQGDTPRAVYLTTHGLRGKFKAAIPNPHLNCASASDRDSTLPARRTSRHSIATEGRKLQTTTEANTYRPRRIRQNNAMAAPATRPVPGSGESAAGEYSVSTRM